MAISKYKIEFLLLKGEDTKCNSVPTLKNLLSSDAEVSFHRQKIRVGKVEVAFRISTSLIEDGKKERYFFITLESEFDRKNEEKVINYLTTVFKKIKNLIIDSGKTFKIAPLWDDTAFYYSKLAYPLIYVTENLMRRLIYKFMLTKLGTDWYKSGIPDEFRQNLSKNEREKSNAYFEASLYNADFIHINNFLFSKYTGDASTVLDKIKKASKPSELSIEELKQLVPEDNWSRFFQPIIGIPKFKEQWARLYELRCKVAHNNLLTKGDFDEIKKLTREFNSNLENAILSLNKVTVQEEDKKELTQSAVSSFTEILKSLDSYNTQERLEWSTLLGSSSYSIPTVLDYTTSAGIFGIGTTPAVFGGVGASTSLGSLNDYLYPVKKCSICGKEYKSKDITLSASPGVCSDCAKGIITAPVVIR